MIFGKTCALFYPIFEIFFPPKSQISKQSDPRQLPVTADIKKLLYNLVDRNYLNPLTPVREFISNAYDSYLPIEDFSNPKVVIKVGPKKLTIQDWGRGMNEKVILEAFTRIAGHFNPNKHSNESIGIFGIGVLSAFLVAELLEVFTYDGSGPHGWHIRWEREKTVYSLSPSTTTVQGTYIILHLDLQKRYAYINQFKVIQEFIIRNFALFPIPIYLGRLNVGKDLYLINTHYLWLKTINKSKKKALLLNSVDARILFQNSFRFTKLAAGYLGIESDGTKIFLAIPQENVPQSDLHRVKFYSKGVFIGVDIIRRFYPENLSFVLGVIDCPHFAVQINREMLSMQDPYLIRVRQRIGHHIISFFEMIGEKSKKSLEELLRTHLSRLIVQAEVESQKTTDSRILALYRDSYRFQTNCGAIYWEEIILKLNQQNDSKTIWVLKKKAESSEIYFLKNAEKYQTRYQLLIYAYNIQEEILIGQLSQDLDMPIQEVSEFKANSIIERPSKHLEKLRSQLQTHFEMMGIRQISFGTFPNQGPAFFRVKNTRGWELMHYLELSLNQVHLFDEIVLNKWHPIIRALLNEERAVISNWEKIAQVFYYIAILNSPFKENALLDIIDDLIKCMEDLIRLSANLGDIENKPAKLKCFVALPYSDEFNPIWEGIKETLTQKYDYHVIRGDFDIREGKIGENLKRHMHECDRFIADISGFNLNVMYERGMMEMLNKHQSITMCDEDTLNTGNVPVDIRSHIFMVYPTHIRENKEEVVNWFSKHIPKFKDFITLNELNTNDWSERHE